MAFPWQLSTMNLMKCYKIFKTDKKLVKIERGGGKNEIKGLNPVYAERLSKE